jgi:hypothetical protein
MEAERRPTMDRQLAAAYAAFLIALAAHAQGDSLEALPRPAHGGPDLVGESLKGMGPG